MSELNLVKKLAKVMQEVKYIQKRGKNAHFGYTYATEADVAEKVREVLASQNVIMLPSVIGHEFRETTTAKGKKEFICTVDMEFTFCDGDSGETLTVKMSGDGQDGGDKAIFKAITGCTKYAQMKSFMIPTGDDPEDDGAESGRKATGKPSQNAPQSRQEAPESTEGKNIPPDALICHNCEAEITPGQKQMSIKNYGKPLCLKCQKEAK